MGVVSACCRRFGGQALGVHGGYPHGGEAVGGCLRVRHVHFPAQVALRNLAIGNFSCRSNVAPGFLLRVPCLPWPSSGQHLLPNLILNRLALNLLS